MTTTTPVPSPSEVASAGTATSTRPAAPAAAAPVRDVVVVGVDGSPSSVQALRWGRFLAEASGSTVEVVTAEPPYTNYGVGSGWAMMPTDWDPIADAEQVCTTTIDAAFGDDRPAGLTMSAVDGAPSQVLLEASRDARMLVMGSRGHGGFAGLLLGSVSTACAEHAHCPVFVVHGDTAPPVAPAAP